MVMVRIESQVCMFINGPAIEREREAAEKLGEWFGTDWLEIAEKKLISVPNLSQEQEGLPDLTQEAFVNQ